MKTFCAKSNLFVAIVGLTAFLFTSSAQAAVKFATGLSGAANVNTAAAEAAAQMKAKLGGTVPDLIIICEDKAVANPTGVMNAVAAEFPGVPLYGRGDSWNVYDPYTDAGVTGPVDDNAGGLALLALCGVEFDAQYITGVSSTAGAATIRAKGAELATTINPLPADAKLVVVFGDMHAATAINNFVPGMMDILGNSFPLLVGSQNDWAPHIYHAGTNVTQPAQAIVLKGAFGVSFAIAPSNDHSPTAEGAAAQRALDAVPDGMEPKLMLWFNCNSRRDYTDLQAHVDAVQAVIGTDVPLFGAYSGGEAGKANNTATITHGTGLGVFALIYDIASPVITPDGGGTYIDPVTVTIGASGGPSIRYTLDGSDPNENSALYTGEILLTGDTTIKARTYAGDGSYSDVETAVFTINTSLANEAPEVYAGAYQRIRQPDNTVQLSGVISDETLRYPPGVITSTWSVVSGAGPVTFGDAGSSSTSAVFSTVGEYLLRLTVSDSEFTVTDDVPVYVAASAAQPVNVPNYSFELDLTGNLNTTKRDFEEVLGWVEGLDQGSGVETLANTTYPERSFTGTGEGLMKGYGYWSQATGQGDWWYQILDHQIEAGRQYRLTFAYGVNSADTPIIASLIDSTMAELASVTVTTGTRWVFTDHTIELAVPQGAAYIGNNLGIKFRVGTRPTGVEGWASVDNVRVEYMTDLAVVAGDLTGNSVVNEGDLKELADQWLWSGAAGGIPEDMVASGSVDFVDFAYLANQWLAGM